MGRCARVCWLGACVGCREPVDAGVCVVPADALPLLVSSSSSLVDTEYTDDGFRTDGPAVLLVLAEDDEATVVDLAW